MAGSLDQGNENCNVQHGSKKGIGSQKTEHNQTSEEQKVELPELRETLLGKRNTRHCSLCLIHLIFRDYKLHQLTILLKKLTSK